MVLQCRIYMLTEYFLWEQVCLLVHPLHLNCIWQYQLQNQHQKTNEFHENENHPVDEN